MWGNGLLNVYGDQQLSFVLCDACSGIPLLFLLSSWYNRDNQSKIIQILDLVWFADFDN